MAPRIVLAVMALLLVIAPAAADEIRRPTVFMVLWRGETAIEAGFRDYLAEHHVDVNYVVRSVDRQMARLPGIIDEIKQAKPDLVYTWGTSLTLGVVGPVGAPDPERYVTDRPTVFTFVADPVNAGIVASLRNPGRNVTGTSHVAPLPAQLKAMEAFRPFHRLGHIYNPAEVNSQVNARQLEAAAAAQGIALVSRPVPLDDAGLPRADALPDLIAQIAASQVDYLYVGPDTFIGSQARAFTAAALAHRLKVFSATEVPMRDGRALVGLVSSYYNIGRFTAFKARQILVGGRAAADIPVETLSRFSYVVNMKVARELGIFPPMQVLRYAELLVE
ncbi:MAG: ABC transporter substrate-binding protein [Magnetospirillum sp.]|nr:ABC transporter substrate-binding protein [Magnetospirillum sp.]